METESDNLISNNYELKKLCRMCLRQEKILKSMFYCSVGDASYAEIYQQCTGFSVESKDTSVCTTSICSQCENNLLFVFEFRQRAQENEGKLEQFLIMKRQNDDQKNNEIARDQFLGIDENFLDYQIESLDELEKNLSECKFKSLINSVVCTTCLDNNCETEKTINGLNSNDSYTILCECGSLLSNRENFHRHYAQKHNKNIFFDKTTTDDGDRNVYEIKMCCNNNLPIVNKIEQCHDDRDDERNNNIWRCSVCNMIFIREDSLRRHLISAHVLDSKIDRITQEAIEELEISQESEIECNKNENKNKKKNKKTACRICGEQFDHRSTKISHMVRNHQTKKAFECTYGCGYSTLKRDRYQAHIDKHENPDKKYNCSVCSQEFNSLSTMNLHRAKHSSSFTYFCTYCEKIFIDKRNYTIHMRLHTRENLFHCEKCHRGFNRKEHLRNHLKRKNECDKDATNG